MKLRFVSVFATVFVIIIIVLTSIIILPEVTKETKIIESSVVDVTFYDNYMTIIFKDGKVYNIDYKDRYGESIRYIDFTVHSKMIIKLEKTSIWFMPNTDDIWTIVNIVKVPSGDEVGLYGFD